MSAEWFKKRRVTPKDDFKYYLEQEVILFSESILKDYGNKKQPCEGFVYWAGTKEGDSIYINSAIAPNTFSEPFKVMVSHEDNFQFIKVLAANSLIQIGQVHSHPGDWVDHSDGDDELAGGKVNGLISVVVPNYGVNGFMDFKKSGVHRYEKGKFIRLTNKYVNKHFQVLKTGAKLILDLRKYS